MDIKAILFDKDGTLIDFDATFLPATARVLDALAAGDEALKQRLAEAAEFNIDTTTLADTSVLIAGSLDDIADVWLTAGAQGPKAQLIQRIDALYREHTTATVTAFPFLVPTLQALAARGIALGIATNDSEQAARQHMDALGLAGQFSAIFGFDSGHGAKPGPGMVRAFADAMDLPVGQIAMVGDSLHDCLAGRAAGAMAIGVASGHNDRTTLQPHCDHAVDDISALPALIDTIRETYPT